MFGCCLFAVSFFLFSFFIDHYLISWVQVVISCRVQTSSSWSVSHVVLQELTNVTWRSLIHVYWLLNTCSQLHWLMWPFWFSAQWETAVLWNVFAKNSLCVCPFVDNRQACIHTHTHALSIPFMTPLQVHFYVCFYVCLFFFPSSESWRAACGPCATTLTWQHVHIWWDVD